MDLTKLSPVNCVMIDHVLRPEGGEPSGEVKRSEKGKILEAIKPVPSASMPRQQPKVVFDKSLVGAAGEIEGDWRVSAGKERMTRVAMVVEEENSAGASTSWK